MRILIYHEKQYYWCFMRESSDKQLIDEFHKIHKILINYPINSFMQKFVSFYFHGFHSLLNSAPNFYFSKTHANGA